MTLRHDARKTMRATAGVFIWAIESTMLGLFGVGSVSLVHVFGGSSPLSADMWAIFVVFSSCILNIIMNTVVAFSSKQTLIQDPTSPENKESGSGVVFMHKSITQGHCSVVAIILALYIIILQQSLFDLNWASAYFPSSPGLVWIVGTVTLAFLTVLFVTSISGSWAATAVGASNPIFFILPTTSIICIMFPIINEIANNGLMSCSSPMISTFAIIYANLALATSFTFSILDNVEFDPVKLLPKFMRTVGDRTASIRIYNFLHGICISGTMIVYWISARKVGTVTIFALIILNGVVTLSTSMPLIASLLQMKTLDMDRQGNRKVKDKSNNAESQSSSNSNSESESNSASGSQSSSDSDTKKGHNAKSKQNSSLGQKKRITLSRNNAVFPNTNTLIEWPRLNSTLPNTPAFTRSPVANLTVAERRIAILRLNEDQSKRSRQT